MNKPEDANEACPGTNSDNAGREDGCKGCPNQKTCQTIKDAPPAEATPEDIKMSNRLSQIKHKILVLSGKGGVGKSTCSTQIAFGLAHQGFEVGILDVDLCGPSIPRTMGLEGQDVHSSIDGWEPICVRENLSVMSVGFLFPSKDDALIWRGPKKTGLIRQFLTSVNWGALDYLIIDTPPGTSDEHISVVQMLKLDPELDGAVLVTTSQKLSVNAVRKEVNFCKKTGTRILGVVENMKDIVCKSCGVKNELFNIVKYDEVGQMLNDYQLPLLGEISFSPELLGMCEEGRSLFDLEEEHLAKSTQLREVKLNYEKLLGKIHSCFGKMETDIN